ncbi:hypothetical protein K439DRAFT_1619076 [Ramaria rubella]|nr:hypothetical protein K439DRAFT_1619076 [Ramaria rubella]
MPPRLSVRPRLDAPFPPPCALASTPHSRPPPLTPPPSQTQTQPRQPAPAPAPALPKPTPTPTQSQISIQSTTNIFLMIIDAERHRTTRPRASASLPRAQIHLNLKISNLNNATIDALMIIPLILITLMQSRNHATAPHRTAPHRTRPLHHVTSPPAQPFPAHPSHPFPHSSPPAYPHNTTRAPRRTDRITLDHTIICQWCHERQIAPPEIDVFPRSISLWLWHTHAPLVTSGTGRRANQMDGCSIGYGRTDGRRIAIAIASIYTLPLIPIPSHRTAPPRPARHIPHPASPAPPTQITR